MYNEICITERQNLRNVLYQAEREICEKTGLDVGRLHKFIKKFFKGDWKGGFLHSLLIGLKLK